MENRVPIVVSSNLRLLTLILCGVFGMCLNGISQNLVPNGSFESVACPDNWQEVGSFGAEHWFNPTQSTPDYFGFDSEWGCYGSIYNSAWQNTGEFQYPQEGERMIGLFHYITFTCVREYVGVKLLEPLNAGALYSASMYAALSNNSEACTDCIGMYLSPDSIFETTTCGFDVTGQMQNPPGNMLSDTLNWMLIQGDFVAQGGEEYLYLGNVSANDSCLFEVLYGEETEFATVYYYIDNVTVERKDDISIGEELAESFQVYPNPVADHIQLRGDFGPLDGELRIIDQFGRVVLETEFQNQRVDVSMLEAGVYLLSLKTPSGILTSRLIIQR